jgi:hypothetical protein
MKIPKNLYVIISSILLFFSVPLILSTIVNNIRGIFFLKQNFLIGFGMMVISLIYIFIFLKKRINQISDWSIKIILISIIFSLLFFIFLLVGFGGTNIFSSLIVYPYILAHLCFVIALLISIISLFF